MATVASPEQSSWIGRIRAAGLAPAIATTLVVLVLLWLSVNLAKTPSDFASVALEGLTLGLVYGLIALGYSLVYGILELINFAHGDVFMLGSCGPRLVGGEPGSDWAPTAPASPSWRCLLG